MADNITILDSSETEKTIATKELSGAVHANKTISVDESGNFISNDPMLDIAKEVIADKKGVNKFGRSTDVDAHATDIWDGAVAGDAGDTWVAPTAARIHAIASTSTDDDGAPVGTGARTIQVYGLADWDTVESSEVITLDGTTGVNTVGSYVIIHRMKVLTWGSSGPNVGTITATAATDSTVTAQIMPSEGQTQMAIYRSCPPDVAYMTKYYASAIKAATALSVEISLLVNTGPNSELTGFLVKHTAGLATEGSNYMSHEFAPYFKISGPAIIKISGNSSAVGTDVGAGFDLILEDGS